MAETRDDASMSGQAAGAWAPLERCLAHAPAGVQVAVSAHNLESGSSFTVHGDRPFPSASTIKVAILIALARAFDRDQLRPDDIVTLERVDKVAGSGVLNWLSDGLRLPLRDLAWLMIAISDNTASNMLMDRVGLDAIAEVLADAGAHSSRLSRHFMAPKGDQPGAKNEITANDFLALLLGIAEDRAASPRQCAWMRSLLADQQVLDRLARSLPDDISFAGKSGWYDDICHDGGLLTGPKGTIGVVVLTRGFSSMLDANAFIGDLGRAAAGLVSGSPPHA